MYIYIYVYIYIYIYCIYKILNTANSRYLTLYTPETPITKNFINTKLQLN